MEKKLKEKYKELRNTLKELGRVAVAFSGGVDSAFLLHVASDTLDNKVLALTVNTPYIPDREIEEAEKISKAEGVEHRVIELPVPSQVKNNPEERCYLCKTLLFNRLKKIAQENGYRLLAEGSNADDIREHRPGLKALRELQVISPLLETGFSKSDIRTASRELGLPTWNKPAYACLLTRIPYNTRISQELLHKIERSEAYLIGLGIRAVRVRAHGNLARIEAEPMYMERIFREKLGGAITRQLKHFGFTHVTLDLEGYRMGGMEEPVKK